MPSEIKIVNIDDIKNRLFSLEKMFPGAIKSIMQQMAGVLLKSVKDKTPVDTGNLRRKWALGEVKADSKEASVEVTNNTEYAAHVEYGHRKRGGGMVEGRFMLRRAMDEVAKNLPDVLEDQIQRYVDKGGK